jgi:osmotically-inducible protein OsmY
MAYGLSIQAAMSTNRKWSVGLAALAAIVAVALMIGRHVNDANVQNTMRADVASDQLIVKALQDAKVPVNGLLVRSSGGVVVVRGNGDKVAVQEVLDRLNVPRVANLVVGYAGDDELIRRDAERQLTSTRALDGAQLHVSCLKGVVKVTGTVQSDLQADVARSVLRGLNGAQQIKVELATPIASAAPRS